MKHSLLICILGIAVLSLPGCQRANEYYGPHKSVYGRDEGPENIELRKCAASAASYLKAKHQIWKKPDHVQLVGKIYRFKFDRVGKTAVIIEVNKENMKVYEVDPFTGKIKVKNVSVSEYHPEKTTPPSTTIK